MFFLGRLVCFILINKGVIIVLKKISHKRLFCVIACISLMMSLSSVCFAAGEDASSASSVITSAITTSATSLQSDAISMIGSVAPYALGIVAAFMLFRLGKKFFAQVGK